jgi:hypothetical protein
MASRYVFIILYESETNRSSAARDFPRHEVDGAARRLVVVENP